MSMFQKKKSMGYHLQQKKTNKFERLQKVTWWLLPIFTHISVGENPTKLALVP